MQVVLQRVSKASVWVDSSQKGAIDHGWLALIGVAKNDKETQVAYLARKIIGLRGFRDDEGKMNKNIVDVGGSILAVSQFTLYGDTRKGNRPGFSQAAPPELAKSLYDMLIDQLQQAIPVATGVFGAMMEIRMVADGPVTLTIHG